MASLTAAVLLAGEEGRLNPLAPHPMEIFYVVAVMLLLGVALVAFLRVRLGGRGGDLPLE